MRYVDAVERLRSLPDPLPRPPEALMPVRLGPGELARAPASGALADAMPAAVLVLITPDRNRDDRHAADHRGAADDAGFDTGFEVGAEVILIERTARGHHSGEISFPGGRVEATDSGVVAAALREAAEEVGLDADAAGVTVIG